MRIQNPLSASLLFASALSLTLISGAATKKEVKEANVAAATKGMVKRQDLEIVDCLLPGQVRQLGNASYVTARRPIKTTASDCRVRGGEYVAFDRANLQSALAVWLQAAEAGDAAAQTQVGEIYERGWGTTPNLESAVAWYQKAAAQGYSRAQFSLGSMYEQGLGVPADKLKALNLYRQSWGLSEDNLMYQSAALQEQQSLRDELNKQIAEKDTQLNLLQKQLKQMQDTLSKQPKTESNAAAAAELDALRQWIARLESEKRAGTERLAGLTTLRTPQTNATAVAAKLPTNAAEIKAMGLNFGRYYALVIGNQHYAAVASLQTPISDAQRAAKILTDKYGFSVQVLEDASDVAMLKALNDLNAVLKPDDNVLIYYAGHGARLQNGKTESGYWLPVNADAPPQDTFWVPNEQITAHLARLPAKRILVVADSCYAGLISSDPSYLFVDNKVGYSADYLKFKLPKRSRLLLSSGGDKPVLDTGGGNNSVFARAFLDELTANSSVLPAPELFARIRKRVEVVAATNKFVQIPTFKSIKGAGHEVGDFFFIPKS